MVGWIVLIIAATILAIWLSVEVRDEEEKPDNHATIYASEISRKRGKSNRKRSSKKK